MNEKKKNSLNVNEFLEISKWVIKVIFSINPVYATSSVILSIVSNIRGITYSWIFAKVLDFLISVGSKQNPNISTIYPVLAVLAGYNLVFLIISFFELYTSRSLELTSGMALQRMLYKKLNSLGIQTLESPEINNRLFRVRGNMGSLINYFGQISDLASAFITTLLTVIICLRFSPIVVGVIILAAIPRYIKDKEMRKKLWKFDLDNTEATRIAGSSASDLQSTNQLQEIFVNNSYSFLDKKYTEFFTWYTNMRLKLRRDSWTQFYIFSFIGDLTLYFGFIEIFKKFFAKAITVGNVSFQMGTISNLQSNLYGTISSINNLFEFSIKIKDTYELFETTTSFEDGTIIMPALDKGPEITLENLHFKYPRTERFVLKGINLKIKPGEKVAIVGVNGAGKTTLVRLLAKMYQASEGRILINGQDINDLQAASLHNNMGILFQDFNTYEQLSVAENIYLGRPDKPRNDKLIEEAASYADASKFISNLPNQFDQTLSEKFKGGVKLSTGQWQKLAIARFFYRNAPLVIFDEPTASIDAASEYNIFNRIYDFFNDKTVLIISHRFSTVRNADRILVLKDGLIVEEGSHEELLKLNGEYAEAFMLQAEGYKTEVSSIA